MLTVLVSLAVPALAALALTELTRLMSKQDAWTTRSKWWDERGFHFFVLYLIGLFAACDRYFHY